MDAACNIVYVDRAARQERMVRRGETVAEAAHELATQGARRLEKNVHTLLETFSKGAWREMWRGPLIYATRVSG